MTIWIVIIGLIAIWILGFIIHVAGIFIHLILLCALGLLVYGLIMRSRNKE